MLDKAVRFISMFCILTLVLTDLGICDDFGFLRIPSVSFDNGEYYGQTSNNEVTGDRVAHGIGSYIDGDGRVVYAGRWFQGRLHGIGQRYFADGANYSGYFHYNQMHGRGQMTWPNGTHFRGRFYHNRIVGRGIMTYPNGHRRKGYFEDGLWKGKCQFVEADGESWTEVWENGTYVPEVRIRKRVHNNYTDIRVEVICKAHGIKPHVMLFKEDQLLEEVSKSMATSGGEMEKVVEVLPFSDDAFKVYTCQVIDDVDGSVIHQDKIQVRNPFFIESRGECGIQFLDGDGRHKSQVPSAPKMARLVHGSQAYTGQVPWQAIINHNLTTADGSTISTDHCGGSIISPWHILTAAHCLFLPLAADKHHSLLASEVFVKVGHTTRSASVTSDSYAAKRVYIHPSFSRENLFNDIAIIVTARKIALGTHVNPVCLPTDRQSKQTWSQHDKANLLTISGFGLTYDISDPGQGWFYPSHLQVGTISVLPKGKCFSKEHEVAQSFQGHFCAGDASSANGLRADTCMGDSGGPVTFRDKINGRHYLLGLVSFGPRVCGSGRGAIYVNVTHYRQWIDKVRLHDFVDHYRREEAVPYDRIDSSIFKQMLNFMVARQRHILDDEDDIDQTDQERPKKEKYEVTQDTRSGKTSPVQDLPLSNDDNIEQHSDAEDLEGVYIRDGEADVDYDEDWLLQLQVDQDKIKKLNKVDKLWE